MAVASVVSKRTFLARESVAGTAVPANKFLEDLNIRLTPASTRDDVRPSGSTMSTGSPLRQAWATFSIESGSYLGYRTSFYTLASLLGLATTTSPATDVYEHAYNYLPDGLNTRPSYTMVTGYRNGTAERAVRATFDSFGFSFSRGAQASLSGGGFARALDMSASTDVNETNVLTIDATGGTFTLAVNGGPSTANIAENAAAAAVQAALEALANVIPGDVTVTGSAGGPYTLVWAQTFKDTNVTLTADGTLLTGGASTAIVTTTAPGGKTTVAEAAIEAPSWGIYIDDLGGTAGTTKFKGYSGEFAFNGLTTPDWVIDPDQDSFDDEVLQVPTLTSNLVLRNDAASRALYDDLMSSDPALNAKLLRFESIGPEIETGQNFLYRMDMVVKGADNLGAFGDQGGADSMAFPFKIVSNASFYNGGFSALLRNDVTGF
jgi:hypothetical protein